MVKLHVGCFPHHAKKVTQKIFHLLRRRERRIIILVPIHRPPTLLHHALNSVLKQTEQNFEVHIICDGAPEETNQAALAWSQKDRRFSAHIMEKGPRNGEAYRDPIIREVRADFVCQIADDDLWFPDHLEKMERMLEDADFGHSIQVSVNPDLELEFDAQTIATKPARDRMLHERYNMFGPTVAAYRRSAYLKLDEGWATSPPDIFTDLHMWRKFLADSAVRLSVCNEFTALHFPAVTSRHVAINTREALIIRMEGLINSPALLGEFKAQLKDALKRTDQHIPSASLDSQDNAAYVKCNFLEAMLNSMPSGE